MGGSRHVTAALLCAVLALMTACEEPSLEEDKQRVVKFATMLTEAMDRNIEWQRQNPRLPGCRQGGIKRKVHATVFHKAIAEFLGHDVDVDRYMDVARSWLPEHGFTIIEDHVNENGKHEIKAINRTDEVDLWIAGYAENFGVYAAAPCREAPFP